MRKDNYLLLYRWALWNFFCTIWVVLEGAIMIYVLRLYKNIREASKQTNAPRANGKRRIPVVRWDFGIPLLAGLLFSFYFFYQYNLFAMALGDGSLDGWGIYRVSVFYIRICGLFWILFEWVVAIIGIRTYGLFKSIKGAM